MPLSVWLLTIPHWLSLSLVTALFTGFGVGLVLVVRQFVHHSILKRHNDIAGFVFATMGVIYGVTLAFVVIVVWQQYDAANITAKSEALRAYSLYRDLSIYPDQEEVKPALVSLAAFSRSVVETEYPALRQMKWDTSHEASIDTRRKLDTLWKDIRQITPQTLQEQSMFNEMLRDINVMGQEREKRLIVSREDLPGVVWAAVVVGGLLTIGFTALFGNENLLAQVVITAWLGIVTSIAIFVIISLNFPFMGEVCINPEGYEHLIDLAGWGGTPGG